MIKKCYEEDGYSCCVLYSPLDIDNGNELCMYKVIANNNLIKHEKGGFVMEQSVLEEFLQDER